MRANVWSTNSDHATSITRSSLTPLARHRAYRRGSRAYSGNWSGVYCCKMVAQTQISDLAAARTAPMHALAPAPLDAGASGCALDSQAPYGIWYATSPVLARRRPADQTTPGSRA